MPSRREFIQCGLAASALAVCPLPRGPVKVVVDKTYPEAVAFGVEAVRQGATVHAVGGNAGGVWMNEIEPLWKRGPAVIAGLTGRASLFCLELLARDYGMGIVYRVEHSRTGHVITGPESLSEWNSPLSAAGTHWGTIAAAMAMSFPAGLAPSQRFELLDLAPEPSLFSWVIAPTRRAGILGGRRG
jgi:hypothetical protein